MVKFSAEFLKKLGIDGDDVTPDTVELKAAEKIKSLETAIAGLKPDAEAGKKLLTDTREKAATLYKALRGENFKQSYVDNVILKSDLESARALVDEYQESVDKAAPLTCPKCGEKLTRLSSATADAQPEKGGKDINDYKL